MRKFIELRFGQGDLGKSVCHRKDVDDGETFIQRELVPVKAIKDAYVILPEKRNIRITFESKGHLFSRTEYYKNEIDCIKRWSMLRRACGITSNELLLNPVPLPMDVAELEEFNRKHPSGTDKNKNEKKEDA